MIRVHVKVLDLLFDEVGTATICLEKLAEECIICELAEAESKSKFDWLQNLRS